MKKPNYIIIGTVATLALPTSAADLFWDPDNDGINNGGAGTWSTGGSQWHDGSSIANWANGDNATFGQNGAAYQIAIDGAGVEVGDITVVAPTGTGKVGFRAQTDGVGITIPSGGAVWDLGGRELEFVNAANANDTPLSMTSGDTLTVTDTSASGVSTFDTGEKPNNGLLWGVDGAFLVVDQPMVVRGQAASIGRFAKVTLVGGSTLVHERNNDGDGIFFNEFEFNGGQVSIDTRFNRRVTFAGPISGTGGLIANAGGGTNESIRLRAANTFSGDITVATGGDNATRGNVGIRVQELGTLGDGSSNIIFQNGKRIEFAATEPYEHFGDITGSGGFDIIGSVLTLSGTNDYVGETFIQGASLIVDGPDALSLDTNITLNGQDAFLVLGDDFGTGTADYEGFLGTDLGEIQWTSGGGFGAVGADRTVSLNGGATLTFGDPFFISDSETLGLQAGSEESTHTTTILNSIVLPTSGTGYNLRSENGLASIDGVFSGVISGDGGVDILGGGVLKLSNTSNSYAGVTEVQQGVLLADPLAAVPDLSQVDVLIGAAFGGSTGSLTNADFDNLLATANFQPGSAVAFDTSAGNYTYASDLTGDVGVAKVGPNDLTLTGAVSYTGATIIYEGNINFPGGSLPAGSALTLNDNQIDLGGSNLNTGGLSSFTDQASVINTGANADLVLDVAEGTTEVFDGTLGELAGANSDFNVVKRGEGTQLFADVNYYTGTTTIAAGRMDAPQPETLGLDPGLTDLTRLTVTGGELRIDAFGANPWSDFTGVSARMSGDGDTVLGLNLDLSNQTIAGTWDPASLGGAHGYRFNTAATGNSIIFDDTNTYTGPTILETGTIVLGLDDNVAGTYLEIINNGTTGIVELEGTNQTVTGLSDRGNGGGFTKSIDNDGVNPSTITIDTPAGEYFEYFANLRSGGNVINIVKTGDGEQVFARANPYAATDTSFTVNAGTLGIGVGFPAGTEPVTVGAGGTFEVEGSIGMEVAVDGTFGPGINGDADNDGISDEDDQDTTDESTVGLATVTNFVGFNDGSNFEFEIGDWNGVDDLGGSAGVDSDLLIGDSLDFVGSMTVVIGGAQLDFSETPKTFVIMQGVNSVNGFNAANVTIDDSAFVGAGTWSITQNVLNIELTYTAGGGDAYDTWASTEITSGPSGFEDDANGDGLANGLNFVLGGDPEVVDFSVLPVGSESAGDFTFNFKREDDSEGITTQTFQWSADLVNWNDVSIGAVDSGPDGDGVEVAVSENGADADDIGVSVPVSNAPGGKLFGRLVVTRP